MNILATQYSQLYLKIPGKMSTPFVVLSIAVLLTSVAAQNGRIPACSAEEEDAYFARLPDSEACGQAFDNVFDSESLNATALAALCSVDCAGELVIFSTTECRNLDFAEKLRLLCAPRETGQDRCWNVFPGVLENKDTLITDLALCANFDTECPGPECASALNNTMNLLGCCYQTIYNNTEAFDLLEQEGTLTAQERLALQSISQASLWEACSVDVPSTCTGERFPGTSQLDIGVCRQAVFFAFVFSLGQNCTTSFATAYGAPIPGPSQDVFDELCDPGCAGSVSTYFRDTCLDKFAESSTALSCYRTDGEIGRCFYAVGPFVRNANFSDVMATCYADPTADLSVSCPSGCQAALQGVKDQLGCCYQNIFNTSLITDTMVVLNQITNDERDFYIRLGSREVWESCGVSLQQACTGDPFTDDAALELVSSTILVIFLVSLSLIF